VASSTGADKATLSSFPVAPDYVTRIRIYRSLGATAEPGKAYHIVRDIDDLQLKSSGTTVLVLDDDSKTLTASAHIGRYVTYDTSGNAYRITANSTTSVTINGDASGESGTDYVSITGGFDYDTLYAGTWVDLVPDDDIDTDHEAPTKNDRPVTGLKYPTLFRGGGRICAFRDGEATTEKSQTLSYVTGRSTTAPVETAEATKGENELDYWPSTHLYAGLQDGKKVQGYGEIGGNLYCFKDMGFWKLYQEPDDIDFWFWTPVRGAESVGCVAPGAIVSRDKIVYLLGHDAQELDIIRFDGRNAFGMFRQVDGSIGTTRLRRVFDDMTSYASAAKATMFQGRLYVSYPGTTGATSNNRTLRWDFRTNTADMQPWGCGAFFNTYRSGDSHVLLCCAPTAKGDIYKVLGTAADDSSDISRELITGEIGVDPDEKTRFVNLALEVRVDDSNTSTDSAALAYSTDGLQFSDTSKTWTSMTGTTWPTTAGRHVVLRKFKGGVRAKSAMIKLSSTDARDWSLLSMKVLHDPDEQKQQTKGGSTP
jgi:hypothetical protein